MAPKVGIPEGFELLVGRGRENAKKALSLATERGFDESTVRVSTALGGFLIPLGDDAEASESTEAEEIVFPDAEKASHADIDAFAETNLVTYEGIEAKNADSPTRAEKVAHLHKVIEARTVEESAAADQTNTETASADENKGE